MMIDDEPKTIRKRLGARSVRVATVFIVAAAVSACGTAAVGPVDHECHANPARSQGSGCDRRRLLVESDGHLYAVRYLDPQFDAKVTALYAETTDLKYSERD